MDITALKESLLAENPPPASSVYVRSLWYDAKNDWIKAHELIQDISDTNASWIHGYLHRKEGDIRNADYWYARAGKKRPDVSLQEEWEQIVKVFI